MTDAEAEGRAVGAEARHNGVPEEAGAAHPAPASEGPETEDRGPALDNEHPLDGRAGDGTETQGPGPHNEERPGDAGADEPGTSTTLVEALAQRDQYLDALRRLKAEFENYRKRVLREQRDQRERAGQRVVEGLLGALDALDAAAGHHPEVVEPLYGALRAPLASQGLERLDPTGMPFDPTEHEAVSHEPGHEGDKAVVVEVLRPGYRWKGRLLRPAMVRVRG